MKYEGIAPITRERAEEALKGNDVEEIVHVLLSITNHERDWEWVQDRALSLLGRAVAQIEDALEDIEMFTSDAA